MPCVFDNWGRGNWVQHSSFSLNCPTSHSPLEHRTSRWKVGQPLALFTLKTDLLILSGGFCHQMSKMDSRDHANNIASRDWWLNVVLYLRTFPLEVISCTGWTNKAIATLGFSPHYLLLQRKKSKEFRDLLPSEVEGALSKQRLFESRPCVRNAVWQEACPSSDLNDVFSLQCLLLSTLLPKRKAHHLRIIFQTRESFRSTFF